MAQADLLHLISSKMDHFQLPVAQTDLIFSHNDHFQCNPSSVPFFHEAKPKETEKKKKKPRSLIEWWPHTYFPARLGFFGCFVFFFGFFRFLRFGFRNSTILLGIVKFLHHLVATQNAC